MKIGKINIYQSPILSVNYKNTPVHLILDMGATASLISMEASRRLNIPMQTTKHKAIQVDGAQLDVVGEIHINFKGIPFC